MRVAMHPDKIEIYSPGGLPAGINKEEYLKGYISILRNPVIANVFFRLHLIEMFGTGIKRIMNYYEEYEIKPIFDISENNICVTLPAIDRKKEVNSDEMLILEILSKGIRLSSSEIVLKSGFGKNKVVRLINSLLEKKYIQKEGSGRGTKYYL
nr:MULTISPECIES: ATP-binding protein [unclassified Treponema]